MKPLVFSPRSITDLEEIKDFIAEDSPARAESFVDNLLDTCRRLPSSSAAHVARPEIGKGVRMAIHGRDVIFFRELPHEIRVERVLHGARDLPRAFRR